MDLDLTENTWPEELDSLFDAVIAINMVNKNSWDCCTGLMRHSSNVLKDKGQLIIYGAFTLDGKMTDSTKELND